jgi:hypothetical protein
LANGSRQAARLAQSASENGVLAYAPAAAQSGRRSLVWVDPEGRETPVTREMRPYAAPRLSPEGKSILVRAEDAIDTWSYEIERGVLTRLTRTDTKTGRAASGRGPALKMPKVIRAAEKLGAAYTCLWAAFADCGLRLASSPRRVRARA